MKPGPVKPGLVGSAADGDIPCPPTARTDRHMLIQTLIESDPACCRPQRMLDPTMRGTLGTGHRWTTKELRGCANAYGQCGDGPDQAATHRHTGGMRAGPNGCAGWLQ